MIVLPGIDLLDGRCVNPVHRSFAKTQETGTHDPANVASAWAQEGAKALYVSDLDGARTGEPQNINAVKAIIENGKIPVYLGGGVRTLDTAKKALDLGVDKVLIGTTAALDSGIAGSIFNVLGDNAILSVGSLNGYVALRDWQARTDERVEDFVARMVDIGARQLVFTDVSRKGMHGGINIHAIKRIASKLDIPLIASGGVSGAEDLRDLKKIEHLGIGGVIVVTALYSGSITLKEAIQICES